MSAIYAVHFLRPDMRSRYGREKPWTVGETRTSKGELLLCEHGYHYCHGWGAALMGGYVYGPNACIVGVDDSGPGDEYKGVSWMRTLVECFNVERELRLFAADEAERALRAWEQHDGSRVHGALWTAVRAARAHARGRISADDLAAARRAAARVARSTALIAQVALSAAQNNAWYAAMDTASDAAFLPDVALSASTGRLAASAARFAAVMHKATGWADV